MPEDGSAAAMGDHLRERRMPCDAAATLAVRRTNQPHAVETPVPQHRLRRLTTVRFWHGGALKIGCSRRALNVPDTHVALIHQGPQDQRSKAVHAGLFVP